MRATNAAINIAPVVASEHDRVAELTVKAYLPSGLPPNDAYYQQLARVADRADQAVVLVARLDGRPVGTVTWCPPGSPLCEIAEAGESEIRMLAVDPAHQRSGVGTALVCHCIDLAAAAGDTAIVLSSAGWMTAAHALYERCGFVRDPGRDWCPRPDVALVCYRMAVPRDPLLGLV